MRVNLFISGACFLLLVVLLSLTRWQVVGWVRGEAFYQGKPTSYWSQQVGVLKSPYSLPPPTMTEYLAGKCGMDFSYDRESDEVSHFLDDRNAAPVLVQLLDDKNPFTRIIAAEALGKCHIESRRALDLLIRELLENEDGTVRYHAISGLEVFIEEYGETMIPALRKAQHDEAFKVPSMAWDMLDRLIVPLDAEEAK